MGPSQAVGELAPLAGTREVAPARTLEASTAAPHIPGLDGLRGMAALYVLLFHCWLLTFPGFPANSGPVWTAWMMYGRLAVVFFLVLSGFSLALSPARKGWQLGGTARFLRRRAWRILPPYWAALAFSLLIARYVVPASHFGPPNRSSLLVYGLLGQDVFTAPTPNGAFWSIAVEAELYLLFPALLLIRRRWGAMLLLASVTLPVIARGLLAPHANPTEGLNWLTPDLAPVFVAGVVTAGIVTASERIRGLPWHWLSALAALPPLALIVTQGSVWTMHHSYWMDLAVVPAMALLLAALTTGHPTPLLRLLATRPIRALGDFSYSLYLIHLPIVMVVIRKLAPHFVPSGVPTFLLTLALSVPLSLLTAWLFARYFENPFKRTRSWKAMLGTGRQKGRAAEGT
ncbi:acyltransferase [Streptomyces sp. NPDC006668]|uniref:acyltransferase family protein n=1 Tax=Streptomyces sp. NPDC006668 TaxID=3156903 RepID=UPI0033E5DD00